MKAITTMSDFDKTTTTNCSSDDTTLNKCLKSDKGFYRILHPRFRLISNMFPFYISVRYNILDKKAGY